MSSPSSPRSHPSGTRSRPQRSQANVENEIGGNSGPVGLERRASSREVDPYSYAQRTTSAHRGSRADIPGQSDRLRSNSETSRNKSSMVTTSVPAPSVRRSSISSTVEPVLLGVSGGSHARGGVGRDLDLRTTKQNRDRDDISKPADTEHQSPLHAAGVEDDGYAAAVLSRSRLRLERAGIISPSKPTGQRAGSTISDARVDSGAPVERPSIMPRMATSERGQVVRLDDVPARISRVDSSGSLRKPAILSAAAQGSGTPPSGAQPPTISPGSRSLLGSRKSSSTSSSGATGLRRSAKPSVGTGEDEQGEASAAVLKVLRGTSVALASGSTTPSTRSFIGSSSDSRVQQDEEELLDSEDGGRARSRSNSIISGSHRLQRGKGSAMLTAAVATTGETGVRSRRSSTSGTVSRSPNEMMMRSRSGSSGTLFSHSTRSPTSASAGHAPFSSLVLPPPTLPLPPALLTAPLPSTLSDLSVGSTEAKGSDPPPAVSNRSAAAFCHSDDYEHPAAQTATSKPSFLSATTSRALLRDAQAKPPGVEPSSSHRSTPPISRRGSGSGGVGTAGTSRRSSHIGTRAEVIQQTSRSIDNNNNKNCGISPHSGPSALHKNPSLTSTTAAAAATAAALAASAVSYHRHGSHIPSHLPRPLQPQPPPSSSSPPPPLPSASSPLPTPTEQVTPGRTAATAESNPPSSFSRRAHFGPLALVTAFRSNRRRANSDAAIPGQEHIFNSPAGSSVASSASSQFFSQRRPLRAANSTSSTFQTQARPQDMVDYGLDGGQSHAYQRHRADSLTVDSTTSSTGPLFNSNVSASGLLASDNVSTNSSRASLGLKWSRKGAGMPSSSGPVSAPASPQVLYNSASPAYFPTTGNTPAAPEAEGATGSQTSENDVTSRAAPPSAAAVIAPIIKVRPEYTTIYRKDPTGSQGKQNVVCVVSIELPSRRPKTASDNRPPPHSQSRLAAASQAGRPSVNTDNIASPFNQGRDLADSRSFEDDRSGSDHRDFSDPYLDHRSRQMQRTGTAAAASTGGSSVGAVVPQSPLLHTRTPSGSHDDRNGGMSTNSNPFGTSNSEIGFRSTYTRSDEKLAGPKEAAPTVGSSDEDAGFSFGATPAAGMTNQDQVLQAATEDLRLRVLDWKGHGINEFGSLLTFGFLSVRQTAVIRHFHVFLFRDVLICINEEKKRGLSRFIPGNSSSARSGPATGAPVTENTLATLAANAQSAPPLKLKGRIYLRHIRKIACSPPKVENTINIKLDDDSLDQFVLLFNTRDEMDVWAKHILGQLSSNALARSTVYGISSSTALRTASEPGRPTPGLGIELSGQTPGSVAASGSEVNTMVSSSTAFFQHPKVNRRADSISKRPHLLPSPPVPGGTPSMPSVGNSPMSPASVASMGNRARSRSPSGQSRASTFANERSSSRARGPPSALGPVTTIAVDDAPYAKWASSGGYNPGLPAPPLLPHSPIDLVVMISVPPPTLAAGRGSHGSTTASLKLRVIRSTLELVISSMGPRDRLAVVTYSTGQEGQVRRTALLNSHKPRSVQKFQQFVHSLDHGWDPKEEDPFLEDIVRNSSIHGSKGAESPRVDSVSAINVGLDIMHQRKSKNPVSGMLLISDSAEPPRRSEMDFIQSRAEAAGVPIHCFGFGKSHDAQTLWQLANQTRGLYVFVREWDQLQECLLGCIGSLMSVALVEFKAHIGIPSDNHFRVRKISGPTGAIISSSGKDVDIEIGELHYGDVKEIFVELEFDFNGLVPFVTDVLDDGRTVVRPVSNATIEQGSATADFMQRLGFQNLSLDDRNLKEIAPGPLTEDIVVLEVDASYRDTTSQRTLYRTPHATVLSLEVDATSPDPLSEASPGTVAVLADPNVTRRRIQILVSEMISRSLYLTSRHNDRQALAVLSETRRIVEIVVQAMSAQDRQGFPVAQRRVRKAREFVSLATIDLLYAILEDLDLLLDELEHSRHHFDRDLRNYAAQQAMILRDQKAWTTRTLLEYMHFMDDNGPALAAHGAILGRSSIRQ
ncbi:hypothetical protein CF327_g3307 [Tilletia walkeri]|uniref:PH domain-containing protein n=1 Tax=Tilletia walkeri TaxID=117179 RepID=A0A8X7T2J2_9BASI|nr:hypothetical protein CF327_g3307 [Tilletia walkeri]KAE8266099.1 hypothetical protein A4X09_0g6248 [Tilletia walkeri]